MNIISKTLLELLVLSILVVIARLAYSSETDDGNEWESRKSANKMCVKADEIIRARRKSCLLRADTGPCRADIVSWYYDAKKYRCYRFFWGGCQGNGNRFVTLRDCMNYCYLNDSMAGPRVPHFCSLAFDFGTCYGSYNRWAWDPLQKDCRRRLYSGCGGNQNNFETREECFATCVTGADNDINYVPTTCIPFTLPDAD
ncbi:BPTI/Kunitz domain-containing protein [Helicoverpa armigera]|uniref:BPTI/Kunitz domain-containing protein n=1 Tax=Helicoverpa armigera TaxID=29058 RepID=UPI00308272EA